jgi:hypothetical protein
MSELIQDIFSAPEKWQTLIGSFFGLFVPLIFSIFGFFMKSWIERIKTRKDCIRKIEISITQTINRLLNAIRDLNDLIKRINDLIKNVEDSSKESFATHRTNFPIIPNIYFDESLSKMRTKSEYLHNKILNSEETIQWASLTIIDFKNIFEGIFQQSESFIGKVHPQQQKTFLIEGLKNLNKVVDDFVKKTNKDLVPLILQTKIYNLKLMKHYFMTRIKYEVIPFLLTPKEKSLNFILSKIKTIDALLDGEIKKEKIYIDKQLIPLQRDQ